MTDTTGNQPKNHDRTPRTGSSDRRDGTRGRPQPDGDSNSSFGGRRGQQREGYRSKDNRGRGEQRGRSKDSWGNRDNENQRRWPREEELRQPPEHNPADLRSSNRPDRGRSPEIDPDVTGKELDKGVLRELSALDEQNRVWVQKHLVMAGRLLDENPGLAFDHALAASRRGGRLGVVREAAGMTAYAAGKFSEALREFRTYRRISGDNSHLPEMVDAERALGRTDKALEMVEEAQLDQLPSESRVELAMVLSGIYLEQGKPQAAVKALEIPQLNPRRGFSYSPRLFTAYADALDAVGNSTEAQKWSNLAVRAERALGFHIEPEPEILDLADEDERPAPKVRARDVVPPAATSQSARAEGIEK